MSFRATLRPVALSLLALLPIPLLALLCRGHTPSRLETANLPGWEQRPPRPLPPCGLFRLSPPPPGTVLFPANLAMMRLLQTDENRLLAGAEQGGPGEAGPAGAWLEAACAWGRSRPDLSAKQDRVALRLMTTQGEDGFFGTRPGPAVWSARDTRAQAACLRGLLAYYALTRRPAAIDAATMAADRVMDEATPSGKEALILPLTRLGEETGDVRCLEFARHQAHAGGANGLAECALYEATGGAAYLQEARQDWAMEQASPALAAELLLLTGRPAYAAALNRLPPTGGALTRAAWTRAPRGMAVNTGQDSDAVFGGVHLRQRTVAGSRTIWVQMPRPTAFTLRVFLAPGLPTPIRVNGILQPPTPPGRYALLARRWRSGDMVTVPTRR